jgi:hypothetical protein
MKLKEKIRLRNIAFQKYKKEESEKVDKLARSWTPLPERGKTLSKVNKVFSTNSNFINCAQQCMNKGKYQGIDIKDIPVWYLKWVVNNIELNDSELKLIRKTINNLVV